MFVGAWPFFLFYGIEFAKNQIQVETYEIWNEYQQYEDTLSRC